MEELLVGVIIVKIVKVVNGCVAVKTVQIVKDVKICTTVRIVALCNHPLIVQIVT